jgi:putative transposase
MIRAYKYRIFPTSCQQQQLAQYFGCARWVYNMALESRNKAQESGLKFPSYKNLANELPSLKGQYPFLRDCPSQSLQQSIKNQTTAFDNFFEGRAEHPNFKSKTDRQSIQLPQGVFVNFDDSTLFIPKLKIVSCKFHRTFQGKIKTVTVSKTPSGSYYASILVESQDQVPAKRPVSKELTIGIDMGIKSLAKFSNGQSIDNPKWLNANLDTLRRLQRSVSRKRKGGNNRKKARLLVAKCHERIAAQRADYLHKLSFHIIKDYDTINIEDLNVSGMIRNRKLSRSIADASWGKLETMLAYKCEWYGNNLFYAPRFAPTSKRCFDCGAINKELKLSDRYWTCPSCGIRHDRDENAAKNIQYEGLRSQPVIANVSQAKR